MKILLVEDMDSMAESAIGELRRNSAHEVNVAKGPHEGIGLLSKHTYDVMIVDMLFQQHTSEFKQRFRSRQVRLSDPELHLSGLALIHAARQQRQCPKPVLWTTGEDNRHLHLQFAYEELGVRVFCSKANTGHLAGAVEHAFAGTEFMDPPLAMYVSGSRGHSIRDTLLSDPRKLQIWRLLALGVHQQQKIAKEIELSDSATRTAIGSMRAKLLQLDPGLDTNNNPAGELIRFAGQNWEFFLDDTLKRMYP